MEIDRRGAVKPKHLDLLVFLLHFGDGIVHLPGHEGGVFRRISDKGKIDAPSNGHCFDLKNGAPYPKITQTVCHGIKTRGPFAKGSSMEPLEFDLAVGAFFNLFSVPLKGVGGQIVGHRIG